MSKTFVFFCSMISSVSTVQLLWVTRSVLVQKPMLNYDGKTLSHPFCPPLFLFFQVIKCVQLALYDVSFLIGHRSHSGDLLLLILVVCRPSSVNNFTFLTPPCSTIKRSAAGVSVTEPAHHKPSVWLPLCRRMHSCIRALWQHILKKLRTLKKIKSALNFGSNQSTLYIFLKCVKYGTNSTHFEKMFVKNVHQHFF